MIRASTLLVLGLFFCISQNLLKAQVIYNGYAQVTAISSTGCTVGLSNELNHAFAATETLIVMQMQDDVIGTNTTNATSFGDLSAIGSAGQWEVVKVASVTRVVGILQSLTFATPLTNTYNVGANSSLQIITLTELSASAFTSSANITGIAWNGFFGGVVALNVGTVFTLGHTINVNSLGFRGGLKNSTQFASTSCDATFVNAIGNKWAGKGEGIYKVTDINFLGARAKILNGGGGGTDENSGGGGGGNWTIGGVGGPGYTGAASGCSPGVGGTGGISLSSVITGFRVFLGGGGGGGHENNSVGTVGGVGGGIVLLKTGTLVTTGTCGAAISANGTSVPNSGNDGSGGGGAAGSIVLNVNTFSIASTCPLTISANGGNGGSSNDGTTHSGGGGGAQGVVIYSTAQPTTNMVTATNNGTGGCNNSSCSSAAAAATGSNGAGILSLQTNPLPVELKTFTLDKVARNSFLKWMTSSEKNCSHYDVQRSDDGINYNSLTLVKSKSSDGNSALPLEYTYTDLNPLNGVNYYRLKVVDRDGSFKYSFIVMANFGNVMRAEDFEIFPNPSTGQFFLRAKVLEGTEENLSLQLFDISGRELERKSLQISSSSPVTIFDGLASGCYIVKVNTTAQQFVYKLFVN